MEYSATSKYIRTSARKMRLVVDAIKKLAPTAAIVRLAHTPKSAAEPLLKVLESAIANAKVKNSVVEELKFARIEVMEGPSLKRFHAVSRGSAHSYKKRMTHVRIVLTDDIPQKSVGIVGGGK